MERRSRTAIVCGSVLLPAFLHGAPAPEVRPSDCRLFISLIRGAPAAPLAPIAGEEIEGVVTSDGKVSFPGIGEGTFALETHPAPGGSPLAVSVRVTLPETARRCRLASFGVSYPLDLAFHPLSAMNSEVDRANAAAAILPRAGTPIPEIRWMVAEQDAKEVWGPMLWTLAGVRQTTPRSAEVWEAWSTENPPFVLQYGESHPGWMAVADGRTVIAAAMPGMDRIAPAEIYADSRAKLLRISFQSPYCRPLDLATAPETLEAGPAYIFVEPAGPNTRKPETYATKERPSLATLGDRIAKLPPTASNLSRPTVQGSAPHPDGAPVPLDPAFASHDPGAPDDIPLWVDAPGGDPGPFVVARGIPLARGILRDEKKAAVLDAADKPVPSASRALAFWPDGSIKWLLIEFQAPLRPGEYARFRLRVGARAMPAPPPAQPVRIAEEAGRITVDTGPLGAVLEKRDGKLALTVRLDLDGDGRAAEDERIIDGGTGIFGCLFSHVDDSAGYRSGTWIDPGRADPGEEEVTEIRVEERSPLRAVILVRANLKHRFLASTIPPEHRPPAGTPVSLRLHVSAGSSLVRLQHTFLFAGDVRHDFLREIGVRLPLSPNSGRRIRAGIDGKTIDLAGECGILQEGPDAALAWRAGEGDAGAHARGRIAAGWLDASLDRWGVTVGLRHMREMFPQEIHADPTGVWTHFTSPHTLPMDVRRYAFKYGSGESTSTGFGSAFGAMRTHEAFWCFRRRGADPDEGIARIRAVLDPPLLRVRPRHVADTRAVGIVAEHGAATNDAHFDAVLLHMPRMHQHNARFWRWYGFWDFGDEIQVYGAGRQRWDRDEGRYGWYNNEPLRDYDYHLAALLSGNRRIAEQAQAMSLHVIEVDVRHARPQPFARASADLSKQAYDHSTTQGIDLCGRRHNCQHWADGYFGPRVGSPAGFRLSYYQTGDPVMGEYLERLIATAVATRRSQYMGADGDEAILWAMIAGHEMTRERKYLDRIEGYARLQVEFAREHGGFPAAQANWDWATNAPGAPAADPRDDLWIWSFGGHVALIEIADLYGDPDLDRMLRAWTLALEGFGPDAKRRDSWACNMGASPLLAHYYRRSGDPRAVEWFKKRAASFHSYIPKDAPDRDLPIDEMERMLPAYTPNDGYGWVYTTSSFWYIGIPAWQGALRERS
ncbi:MAG: hypothetical protein JXP34_28625 [Planctomycetes bacterium]|nr:hypothetical protein [Planctomycetota bacterium]